MDVVYAGLRGELTEGADVLALVFAEIPKDLGILAVGYFLWNGRNWARITFMVLLGLSALWCTPGLVAGLRDGVTGGLILPVLTILVCVLFMIILNGRGAREYCTR